jgi:ATP-dependent Clp protease ATP-binding subunit ClpC
LSGVFPRLSGIFTWWYQARSGSALLYDRFSKDTIRVFITAHTESFSLNRYDVGCEQLFLALLNERKGLYVSILSSMGLTLDETRRVVKEISGNVTGPTANEIIFTPDAEKCLSLAWGEAQRLGVDQIGPEHILLALLVTDSRSLANLFAELRINRAKFKEHVFKLIS